MIIDIDNFVLYDSGTFTVTEMTERAARVIAAWKYEPPFDIYSFAGDDEELNQVMNGLHFPVYFSKGFDVNPEHGTDNVPCGFIAWGPAAVIPSIWGRKYYKDDHYNDLALGLAPENCGDKLGEKLVTAALGFMNSEFPGEGVRLTVDSDNIRAVKIYERCGFKPIGTFRAREKNKRIKFCVLINA